jgi:hypothetical protein
VNPDILVAIISAASSAAVAITALVLNQRGFTTIENRITDLSTRMNNLDNRLSQDIRDLRNEVHEEIKLLTGKVVEIDNRLSRIEDRIGPR